MNAALLPRDPHAQGLADELAWLRELLHGRSWHPWKSATESISPMDTLVQRFQLSAHERAVLLLAAAPDLDVQTAECIANVMHQPRPNVALAQSLLGEVALGALAPHASLRRFHLLHVHDGAFMQRTLHADERVVFALHGIDTLDAWLAPWLSSLSTAPHADCTAEAHALARALADPSDPLVVLMGEGAAERRACMAQAARLLGAEVLRLDAPEVAQTEPDPSELAWRWRRESALAPRILLVEAGEWPAHWRDALEQLNTCVVAVERVPPRPTGRQCVVIRLPAVSLPERHERWLASHPQLSHEAAWRMACTYRHAPEYLGHPEADEATLHEACRAATQGSMAGLGERIDTAVDWSDLVVPPDVLQQLHDLAAHARTRVLVSEVWGFARRSGRGNGMAALFSGPSGTGKTLAARIVAHATGHDLYRVDLSRLVSKYIGETEKNLARVFDAADGGGAVLLFDEADALFGKRSEVKDSHDRYANLEIAYLLQRIESFHGLAILTSNLEQALDTAFLRRLAFVVRFPFPVESAREDIWLRAFPADAPLGKLPFRQLARAPLAGGHIAAIAWSAACRAAEDGTPVELRHVIDAARAECMKLERPLQDSWLRGDPA